jgi:hypothetical protein
MVVEINNNKIKYLNYFLLLEKDLETIFKFIEPVEENMTTYSLENVRLYLSICSEIDILFKQILPKNPKNIDEYQARIIEKYGDKFYNQKVKIEKYDIIAKSPWVNFKDNKNPDWWTSYNKIKHNRLVKFNEATLKNIINAISGLYILVCFYFSDNEEQIGYYSVPGFYKHVNTDTLLCKLDTSSY